MLIIWNISGKKANLNETRTLTPAFWDTPAAPWLPYQWFTSDPKSKQDKVKVTNFKNLSKIQILHESLHVTNLLKLLDEMYKYEMDPTRTVGATEQTGDAGRTDRRTEGRTDGRTDRVQSWQEMRDGRTDGRTEWNQYTPQQLHCAWGIIMTNQPMIQHYSYLLK